MTEDEIEREAKRMLRVGIPDLVDMHDGINSSVSAEERAHLEALVNQMQKLIQEGYEPEPMPELGNPTRLESGDLRFLAKSDATRERAERALADKGVQDWVYFNGEEDEKVTGRVISVEPVHALAYFTVRPEEDGA